MRTGGEHGLTCGDRVAGELELLRRSGHIRGNGLRLNRTVHAIVVLVVALLLGSAALWAGSQEPASQATAYEGSPVEAIQFPNLSDKADQERLLDLIPQKLGQPLSRDLVKETIRDLFATGRFNDIRVEAERASGGRVHLSIFTTPNLFVSSVRAEGAPNRPTAGQIVNASKLELGRIFTQDKLDRGLENIKSLMQENGFYRSSVSSEQHPDPAAEQISVTFNVQPGPPARVGNVTVKCDAGCSPAEVQRNSKLKTGSVVSSQRTSTALERLRKKYQKQNRLLAQVSIVSKEYRPDKNTIDYALQIAPGPKVVVSAQGFKIRHSVLKQNVPIFEENAIDEDLLNEGRRNLLNYMQGRGYFDAKVDLQRQTTANGETLNIIYVIDPGARHQVGKIEITGNQYFLTESLLPRLQVQATSRLFTNGRYNQHLLDNDIHGLENLYRANGFQHVKVTAEVTDNYRGKENDILISIKVEEGPQTRVGKFSMVGIHAFTEAQLAAEINTAENQPFSEYNIAEDRDNILNYYFNRGFPHATFEATANPLAGQDNLMDVTFTVEEGDQVFVDHVFMSGMEHTRPYIVQREVDIKSGDPLSQIDLLQTQKRLYDLGIFSQVDTAVQNPDGSLPHKSVLIDVQEAKRYTFTYGVGLEFQTGQPSAVGTNQAKGETGVSPRVSFAVTRLNFRGKDHTITFKADVGGLQQRGLVSYVAPRWFRSPNWQLNLTAFYDNTLDVTTFTSQRLEGSIQAQQIATRSAAGTPVTTMDYSFTYRRVKASDIQISPQEIPLLSLPVRVGEPGFSYARNTRDSDIESTKGTYNGFTMGVASSYFGSEADFSRVLVQNSTYHAVGKNPQHKFVIARSTRVGVENAFGNTSILPPGQSCPDPTQTDCPSATVIPLAERFLAGGGNSHRGFGLNQAGPRDPTTGFPLGGSALFLNNVEVRLPPTSLPYFQDNMSFVFFEDAGNVFTDGRSMLDNLLRWRQKDPQLCLQDSTAKKCDYSYVSHAIGVGVRYKTPIGPVRFDFGYNLNPPAFPSCQATPHTSGQGTSDLCEQRTGQSPSYFVPQHASHFNVYFSIGQSF